MKAISLRPEWAMKVAFEGKSVECRTWQTSHRGDLLICSSNRKLAGAVCGYALCIVRLDAIEPFAQQHLECAHLSKMPDKSSYAWHISNLRLIEPFEVKCRLGLYEVEDSLITPIADTNKEAVYNYYFLPLVHKVESL